MLRLYLAAFLALTFVGCNESHSLSSEAGNMDFGRISRNAQPILLDEWNQLVDSYDFLQPIPDRKGTNPFTNEEVVFSGEGKAYYVENGEKVGNIALEDGELGRLVCRQQYAS